MSSNQTIHIVSHTHWDREWYFSTCDSLVLLDQTVTDIIHELNNNPNVNFCLDGQISIVKEYLKIHPEMYQQMVQLVNERRLFIGPWQTQTDTQLVSVQSIVNNLYYGIYDSQSLFNQYMKIGYLPDTFGFSNQLPMIFKQFEIESMIFWRGIDYQDQKITPYFTWIGQDDSEITAINLPKGYGMAKGLKPTEKFKSNILDPIIDDYQNLTSAQDWLIPVGNDQNNIVTNLDQKIKHLDSRLKISDYETFANSIKDQVEGRYRGEFRKGRYSRIHKSAGSIRLAVKKSNYESEIALTKILEPINVMAKMMHLGVSYHLIGEAWRMLFEGQAHDSIVGCVSDSVAEDILNRNKKVLEIAHSATNYIKKQIALSIDLKPDEILVFNTEVTDFYGYKELEIVSHAPYVIVEGVEASHVISSQKFKGCENALVETPEGNYYEKEEDYYIHKVLVKLALPSFGYKVFHFREETIIQDYYVNEKVIKNQKYEITYHDYQVDLKIGEQQISNFISLWDMGNEGDTYDFSPLKNDQEMILEMKEAKVYHYAHMQKMIIDCSCALPYDLSHRLSKDVLKDCPCQLMIELRDDNLIYIHIDFENNVLCHRLRLKVKDLHHNHQVLAATPGGSVVRDILKEEIPQDWQKHYVEYPIDIETNSGFVGFTGHQDHLVIFNKGIKEYQARNDAIYMTLFASCDELGKPDLQYRPGRASGDTTKKGHIRMQTPLAQELGKQNFDLAISYMKVNDKNLYQTLSYFESPSVFYQKQDINLFYERIDNKIQFLEENIKQLPKEQSLIKLSNDLYVFSIYSSLYDGQSYIRFMSFEDKNKDDIACDHHLTVSNLLEHGQYDVIKAYRMYTLGGLCNGNK